MFVKTGQIVTSINGRELPAVPKIDCSSDRKLTYSFKRLYKWLLDNAIAEAIFLKDDFNLTIFKSENSNALPPATIDSINLYLFGE